MNKLNKTFQSGNVLTAAELNLLTAKIDEIVNNLPSSTTPTNSTDGVTEQDIIDRVNSAKSQLEEQIAAIRTQILQFDDGNTHVRTDQELLDLFKSAGKEVLVYYGVCDSEGHPFFSALIDEDGVKPAAIIGAITDNNGNLSSSIGISADQIILDGNTTLTGKLTALDADIANINIPDTATIKNAVISDIEAGNVTITGTLHYNRIIGNVTSVSSTTQLQDAAYFVQFTGPSTADVSQYPTLTLPAAPEVGQTLFINVGSKCCKLAANKPIDYFYMYDELSNGEYSIWSGRINTGETLNVADAGWNGVVQFIYTGTLWQQLIHNIRI